MSDAHNPTDIIQVFNELNNMGIEYLVARNSNQHLPQRLEIGKDIDLVVRDEHALKLLTASDMSHEVRHPNRFDKYIYGTRPPKMFKMHGILIDVNLTYLIKSYDELYWMPLDCEIIEASWRTRKFFANGDVGFWMPSNEVQFVFYLAHCVFTLKMDLSMEKRAHLDRLFKNTEKKKLVPLLEKIFFNFTGKLLEACADAKWGSLRKNYLKFGGY